MNLLTSAWVPALLPDGQVQKLSLRELPASGALRVVHPRADFSALITEMLVSLYQTLAAPASAADRSRMLRDPSVLDWTQFDAQQAAFELLGDGARFMQSPGALGKDAQPISALLFEAPGENTIKKNVDHQHSRHRFGSMCPHCAAVGLFLTQAHARQNGAGYYTGPRGGSAMTALVQGSTLWETIVLNLLPQDRFLKEHADADAPMGVYPWTTGEASFTSSSVTPDQYGAHAVLWWSPVAIRLVAEANTAGEACSECGEVHDVVVSRLFRAATKARCPSLLRHPLTCYTARMAKDGKTVESVLPLMVPQGGLSLEDWVTLSLGSAGQGALPALTLLSSRQAERVTLRAFGPQMNIATLTQWFDETAPVFTCEDREQASMVKGAATTLLSTAIGYQVSLWKAVSKKLDVRAGKRPMPLRQAPAAVMAQFQVLARRSMLKALGQYKPDLGALPQDAQSEFGRVLRQGTMRLFTDNVTISVQDTEETSQILASQAALHRSLWKHVAEA